MHLPQLRSGVDSDDNSTEEYDGIQHKHNMWIANNSEHEIDTDDEGTAGTRSEDEDFGVGREHNLETPDTNNLDAIKKLIQTIAQFEEECTTAISDLKKGTKEMIDLVSAMVLSDSFGGRFVGPF